MTDPSKLRAHYLQSKSWKTDVLAVLPTDLAYVWWAPYDCAAQRVPCSVIVRLNRLFKLPRLWEWFERTETDTNYPNVFRICKVVLAILVLIHWNACLYFAISYAIGKFRLCNPESKIVKKVTIILMFFVNRVVYAFSPLTP